MSAVTDYYKDKWTTTPVPMQFPTEFINITPIVPTKTGYYITAEQWQEYQDLKKLAQDYDNRTGQPHCEKPDIQEWEAVIVKVLQDRGLIKVGGSE
jgi:hypothetical protein